MSLDIRYLTNGEKTAYRVRNAGVEPVTVDYYERIEDIPESIRYYAENEKLKFVGPNLAYILGAGEYFYPNFPKCGMPDYEGRRCIAEDCVYGLPNYKACQYFPKESEG